MISVDMEKMAFSDDFEAFLSFLFPLPTIAPRDGVSFNGSVASSDVQDKTEYMETWCFPFSCEILWRNSQHT